MPPAIAIVIITVHYTAAACCEFRHIHTSESAGSASMEV
jgi:hypothetical protein